MNKEKSTTRNIRLPLSLLEKIAIFAADKKWSINGAIVNLLEAGVKGESLKTSRDSTEGL